MLRQIFKLKGINTRFFATATKIRNLEAPSNHNEDLIISNPDKFEEKINAMKGDKFSIFSDFDHTLTRKFIDGQMSLNTIEVFHYVFYII